MKVFDPSEGLVFEGFRLDERGLFRRKQNGDLVRVQIGSRALEILSILIGRPGALVSRDEIMNAVWPETVVEASNLAVQIASLRRVLDNGRSGASCIQTVAGRGYRFVGMATREGGEARPRLSIVVLPFINLSENPEQQYFADGITDDVTTDLSRLPDMFVISRNTAFTYRDRSLDTKQIGCELGVRYLLEGSVRRSGDQVRLNAQLIDAESGALLWAERFDRNLGDPLAVQDEITSRIAIALRIDLIAREAAYATAHPDAMDYILRGRAAFRKSPRRENYLEIVDLFERALALDDRSVAAKSWLATALAGRVLDQMSDAPAVDVARAESLVAQALATAPNSSNAHYAKGLVLRAQGRPEDAIPEFELVIESDRNFVHALHDLGNCKLLLGSMEEAFSLYEKAIRLSPRDPFIGVYHYSIAVIHLMQSRTGEALLWLEKARRANPELPYVHALTASAYALSGEIELAVEELAEARKLAADDRYLSIAYLKQTLQHWGVPEVRALLETTYFAGLRKAGMAEK
jgi:adenylate cyclase